MISYAFKSNFSPYVLKSSFHNRLFKNYFFWKFTDSGFWPKKSSLQIKSLHLPQNYLNQPLWRIKNFWVGKIFFGLFRQWRAQLQNTIGQIFIPDRPKDIALINCVKVDWLQFKLNLWFAANLGQLLRQCCTAMISVVLLSSWPGTQLGMIFM